MESSQQDGNKENREERHEVPSSLAHSVMSAQELWFHLQQRAWSAYWQGCAAISFENNRRYQAAVMDAWRAVEEARRNVLESMPGPRMTPDAWPRHQEAVAACQRAEWAFFSGEAVRVAMSGEPGEYQRREREEATVLRNRLREASVKYRRSLKDAWTQMEIEEEGDEAPMFPAGTAPLWIPVWVPGA